MGAPESGPSSAPARLFKPQVRLFGEVDDDLFHSFQEQIDKAEGGEITIELTTFGGDADVGRRIREDIRILTEHCGKTLWFAGRTIVYSAGATIMSAFPNTHRYLSKGCIVMVHERKMNKEVNLSSAMQASLQDVDQLKSEIETAMELQRKGFRDLIEGSDVSFDEICDRAARNWYITADEALKRKLIAGVF